MKKCNKSTDDLQAIRDSLKVSIGYSCAVDPKVDTHIVVGMGTCGIAAGAREVVKTFMEEIEKRGLVHVKVTQSGCVGKCEGEPIVEVSVPGKKKVTYTKVNPDKAREIIASLTK